MNFDNIKEQLVKLFEGNLSDKAREMQTSGWVESISDYLPDSKGLEKQRKKLNTRKNT